MSNTLVIRSNAGTGAAVLIPDLGFLIPAAGGSTTRTRENSLLQASKSQSLRGFATDDAFGVGSSTLILTDGTSDVAQADVDTFLSNLRVELNSDPYGVYGADSSGEPSSAVPGSENVRAFTAGVVVNDAVYQKADGSVDKADASGGFTAGMPCIGIVSALNSPSAGLCRVRFDGDLGGFTLLVAQKVYIVGQTPGTIVADDDTGNPDYPDTTTGSGHIMQEVGIAKDATTLALGVNRDYMEF